MVLSLYLIAQVPWTPDSGCQNNSSTPIHMLFQVSSITVRLANSKQPTYKALMSFVSIIIGPCMFILHQIISCKKKK